VRAPWRAISGRLGAAAFLLAAFTASAAAQQTGSVLGTVRMATGPLANARAILDTSREVRTDAGGRFRFADVAAGRHTLTVLAIGATPYSATLIVPANDSLDFEVVLVRTVMLDSVVVEGSTVRQGFVRAYDDRKRVGLGKYMDSIEVRKFGNVPGALLFIPGVRRNSRYRDSVTFSDKTGAPCLPNVWIDNQNWGMEQGVLKTMSPDDVAAIEVYTRTILIPEEFTPRGIERGCGALVIWTKRFWPQGRKKPE
jgi:hypothetical protein